MTKNEIKAKHLKTRGTANLKSTAKYRHSKMDYIDSVKTPCVKCGDARKYVIDFHHVDPSTKSYTINTIIRGYSWQALKEELKKCVCLCRNCHQEFHYLYGNTSTKEDFLEYMSENVLKNLVNVVND